MSLICYYVRLQPEFVPALCPNPDAIFEEPPPDHLEVMDVDRAYEALAWLASPLKRAEAAHMARLIREPDWPDEDADESVAQLDAMALGEAVAAIEGRATERIEAINFGPGAAGFFPPQRVRALSATMNKLSEAELRARLDFKVMDENDVVPGYWQEEGEDIFLSYVMPAFGRLRRFYASAAANGDAVIVAWT
ncbi:DUF1877 family protein [Sphingomonas cavernae]|uniref:DUF1877 family protein n=1 Tax=Sphingomonas cavernae TaxID=2320861 RepID=A0A418WQQ0_9SPHN|nr:DUF1877 family protein [Sphingomonas cavernae]RJF93578.1 DUF1877 family protein [Sphingomonas cavernae]